MSDKEERVRVVNPEQSNAVANPLRKDLKAWLDQGWVVDEPKEGAKK